MRFPDWVHSQPRGTLKRLERETGLGYTTLLRCVRGEPCGGRVAKQISDATGGIVTVEELVCPPGPDADDDASASTVANPTNTREVRS